MITGSPVFDGMVVFTIAVDFTKPNVSLSARAAFVNTATGQTHGWTDGDGGMWSAGTMRKLADLRSALESDLGAKHLGGGGSMEQDRKASPDAFSSPPDGIGERLEAADKTPSV